MNKLERKPGEMVWHISCRGGGGKASREQRFWPWPECSPKAEESRAWITRAGLGLLVLQWYLHPGLCKYRGRSECGTGPDGHVHGGVPLYVVIASCTENVRGQLQGTQTSPSHGSPVSGAQKWLGCPSLQLMSVAVVCEDIPRSWLSGGRLLTVLSGKQAEDFR